MPTDITVGQMSIIPGAWRGVVQGLLTEPSLIRRDGSLAPSNRRDAKEPLSKDLLLGSLLEMYRTSRVRILRRDAVSIAHQGETTEPESKRDDLF